MLFTYSVKNILIITSLVLSVTCVDKKTKNTSNFLNILRRLRG